jgi:hypothetical protein
MLEHGPVDLRCAATTSGGVNAIHSASETSTKREARNNSSNDAECGVAARGEIGY